MISRSGSQPKTIGLVGPEMRRCVGRVSDRSRLRAQDMPSCAATNVQRGRGVCGLPVAGQATLPTNLQPFECRLSRRCREPFENPTKNQWVNLLVAILAVSPARDTLAIGDFQLMPRTLKYSDGRIAVFCA